MTDKEVRRPVDQLVELFVYAPVGLVYEYQDVLPKLIRRGKSQIQIAKLLGTMAAKQGQKAVEGRIEGALDVASSSVAQGITDVGARVGLAPDPATRRRSVNEPVDTSSPDDRPLPIAGYDELTAKKIIALLPDLNGAQRTRVASYEASNRARKTVLAKLTSLAEES